MENGEQNMEFTIQGQAEIRVYVGGEGDVCISQTDAFGNEPSVVIVRPANVPQLIRFLEKIQKKAIEVSGQDA